MGSTLHIITPSCGTPCWNIKLELLTDIDMVYRAWYTPWSECLNKYARANNKYMPSDPSKSLLYLIYYDDNNLYGWTLCQYCLMSIFEFDDVQNFDFTIIALKSVTGYILEVDVEYPQHLYDAYTDLSFYMTRETSARMMTSSSQHYATCSVTSYIIVICSSVFVMVSVS